MKKYLFLIFSLALFAVPLSAAQKTAYANTSFIVSKLPQRAVVTQELGKMRDRFSQEGAQLTESFQEKYREVLEKNEAGELSEAALQAAQLELQKMQADIEEHTRKSQQELARRQQVLLAPIIENMEKAVRDVAKSEGYDFVLDSRESGIIYANESYDITLLVLKKLGVDAEKPE